MATVTPLKLLTAEEFFLLPTPERPTELVRGEIVDMNQPGFQHDFVCGNIAMILGEFVKKHSLGRVTTNDVGVITERDPDSVRGVDVAYYSFARLPKEQRPQGYPEDPPEIVFEVRSPEDRWKKMLAKAAEYLLAGVDVVVLVDPDTGSATVCHPDERVQVIEGDECLEFPELLPGFSVSIAELLSD
ncbi:MAG: Uma2 family endonuclease [Planctomycetaceae bacterium]